MVSGLRAKSRLVPSWGVALFGSLLATTLGSRARAAAPKQAQAISWDEAREPQPSEPSEPPTDKAMRAAAARKRHALTFGATVGGVWGGVYASERNIGREVGLFVRYDDGHTEPVDLGVWSGGVFMAYEYGPEDLRLQATVLARFETESYSAGGNEYEVLSGYGMLSSRYALLVGPAFSFLRGTHGSLDAGLGIGGVVGYYRPAAGITDAVIDFAGDGAIQGPGLTALAGIATRAWVSGMVGRPDRKFGIGVAVYYDLSWVRADLPSPWPNTWIDQSFGFMLPISTRF